MFSLMAFSSKTRTNDCSAGILDVPRCYLAIKLMTKPTRIVQFGFRNPVGEIDISPLILLLTASVTSHLVEKYRQLLNAFPLYFQFSSGNYMSTSRYYQPASAGQICIRFIALYSVFSAKLSLNFK